MSILGLFLSACDQSADSSAAVKQVSQAVTGDIDWSKAGPDARQYKIDFQQVKDAVANGAKFYDVRSEEEYQASNFGITESLPIADLLAGKIPDLDKDTPIYVHCLKGIRSAQAAKLLKEAGFTHVFDMGGLEQVEAIGGVLSNQ